MAIVITIESRGPYLSPSDANLESNNHYKLIQCLPSGVEVTGFYIPPSFKHKWGILPIRESSNISYFEAVLLRDINFPIWKWPKISMQIHVRISAKLLEMFTLHTSNYS